MGPTKRGLTDILERLIEKGEDYAHLTWVGKDYSKADLIKALRLLIKHG